MNVQNIVTAAETARDQHVSAEQSYQHGWSSADAHRQFIRALETLSFWADSPKSVVASATGNHCWGYLASGILDGAFADAYPDFDLDGAYIEDINEHTCRLVIK